MKTITFEVSWNESTVFDTDGTMRDETRGCDPCVSDDFETLADALAWAKEQASRDRIEVVTDTRHGNGTITRNVYEINAFTEDEDGETVLCTYDGEPCEYPDREMIDVLDLHPEVLDAWEAANRSFCKWLDYQDNGMDFESFRDALEYKLGEGWGELDWIKWA